MSYLDKLKPLDSGNSKSAGNPTPSTGYTSKLQPYEEKNTEKKQGFLEKMARGIVSPVATLAARPFQLGAELLGASPEKVDKFSEKYSAGLVAPTPKTGGDIVKDIGRGLETVSLGIGGGGIKTAGKEVLKGATKQAIKQGVKEGAIAGGIGGFGSGLEQGQNLPSSIGTGAIGAVTGGVLGGAIGGGASVIKNKIAPTPEYLGKNLDTRIRKALEGTTGDATLIEEKAFKAKKALQLLTSESEGLSIPDTSASLGSGKTKPFDITKAKPNELVSAVVEMGKKIATNARQTAERASNFGKKVNIDEAIGKVKRAVDDGVIPKATGARLEKQLNNLGNDPLKTHDWIEKVNTKYKNKYERGTISDTALGGVADDVADTLRSQLDLIVDRKGYAEAFGNNQELKRIIVQAAKKANKSDAGNVNFGDVSLDAAISVITGNPAYMARTVGSGIFRGLISSFRNQSPIRNLKKAADLTKRVSSISKLPSSEIKGGSQLALPSPESGIRSEIRASNPIKVAPLGSNMEFTGKGNFIDNIKPLPKNKGFIASEPYKETGDLTTKILKDLEGKTTVSKQYILDATNRGELKQVERDITRQILDTMPDGQINVKEFADKVKAELLPLEIKDVTEGPMGGPRYENITLPDGTRGDVMDYNERIYESPIKTSAGQTHFGGDSKNYFGHTRIEDMADNKTRRVIEVQSDLYQKGNLEQELPHKIDYSYLDASKIKQKPNNGLFYVEDASGTPVKFAETKAQLIKDLSGEFDKKELKRIAEVKKLQQYNDPTAHFRMIREEIKKAAEDGKTKLQFPTGETVMKIEGLGEVETFRNDAIGDILRKGQEKVGMQVTRANGSDEWIITDVLGDGKFKAVPKDVSASVLGRENFRVDANTRVSSIPFNEAPKDLQKEWVDNLSEQFDISGKVDTNNPIYKFYEKDVQKYLNKFGGKKVVDDKGVSWIEVPIKKEYGSQPVDAFGKIKKNPLLIGAGVTGIGAIGAGAFPEKSKEQFTPVQKKVNDSREEFKRRISTVENEALVTRGKDAYKSVGTTGDLGKYQVNPKSLKDWGKAWLGKEVSKSEFLGSPKLQEEFFSEFQNVVDRLKLSPEEAAIAWHSGWGILGKDRQTTTRQERDNEFRQYIKRKMREDEPRRYLSKFNNVK